MSYITPRLDQIKPSQVDPALGYGTFACVSRITGTDLAVKVPFREASHHISIEQSIYERLGEHHLILKYYQPTSYISGGQSRPALVLHFLQAGTLEKNLNTPLWVENKARWLLQVSEVVAYVHSKRVIHYDLGCHNFLVQNNGDLALCDFGGSSIDGREVLEFPKPRYARPRLTRDEKPNFKDDIFALGTTLYEISTGQKLYKEKDDCEIAMLFRSHAYPNLQELLPLDLADIIRSCWSGRYTAVEQIVHDLRLALYQKPQHVYLSAKALSFTTLLSFLALCIFVTTRKKTWIR